MTRTRAIDHVRRWLWFWIQPLEVLDRSGKAPNLELITAVFGSGVWDVLAGVPIQIWIGDSQVIWVLSLAVAVVGIPGIALGVWPSISVLIYLLVLIAAVIVFSRSSSPGMSIPDMKRRIGSLTPGSVAFIVLLPIMAFALLPHLALGQIPQ